MIQRGWDESRKRSGMIQEDSRIGMIQGKRMG